MSLTSETIEITRLVNEWVKSGEPSLHVVFEKLSPHLKRYAQRLLSNEFQSPVQATELFHEAVISALSSPKVIENRHHFLRRLTKMMKNHLVDEARKRNTVRHGRDFTKVELEDAVDNKYSQESILAMNEALEILRKENEEYAEIVELRFYGSNSFSEISNIIGVPKPTVQRRWLIARAFLSNILNSDSFPGMAHSNR